MKGKHHIVIETGRLKYEFDIRRNITVIQGESATGKTTLISLIQNYAQAGERSGVHIQSDVPCVVCSSDPTIWRVWMDTVHGSIVFFDEGNHFVYSREFAEYIRESDNYYVFISRKPLKNLPYSIQEIYGIRTTGKYHFPEKVYHEFYPIYTSKEKLIHGENMVLLIEDAKSGLQFYQRVGENVQCISAGGNSGVYGKLMELPSNQKVTVIADGAAFGAYIHDLLEIRNVRGEVGIYLPESFEWIILKSGAVGSADITEILEQPEKYIDSSVYFSWEQFFTALLKDKSSAAEYMQYRKEMLSDYYMTETNIRRIMNVLPDGLREILKR